MDQPWVLLTIFVAFALASLTDTSNNCNSPVSLSSNPFASRALHWNSVYRNKVLAAALSINDTSLKSKAHKVAETGTFLWLNSTDGLDNLQRDLETLPCSSLLGIVIKNLPRHSPSSVALDPYLSWAPEKYKSDYIDPIVKVISNASNAAVVAILEPGALEDIVRRNVNEVRITQYRDALTYVLEQLNLPNVAMYLDASQGMTLGWKELNKPAAVEMASLYNSAGKPKQLRGFATNVGSYNSWKMSPAEFEPADDAYFGNKALDESRYVQIFSSALASLNMSVPNHAIVDTSRSGVQGLRANWTDWCNVRGAGFGVRPTNLTGDENTDAFVWVKNGGESDGTSGSAESNYDHDCDKMNSFRPSPPAGVWNQRYFEELLGNAYPPL